MGTSDYSHEYGGGKRQHDDGMFINHYHDLSDEMQGFDFDFTQHCGGGFMSNDCHNGSDSGGGCFSFLSSFCDASLLDDDASEMGGSVPRSTQRLASSSKKKKQKKIEKGTEFDETMLMIGEEISKISLQERLKYTEEVHGVFPSAATTEAASEQNSDQPQEQQQQTQGQLGHESPRSSMSSIENNEDKILKEMDETEYLIAKIQAFQSHIQNHIPPNQKEAYERACSLAPHKYGPENHDFHRMWLLAFDNDPKEASTRMCTNFGYKAKFFGMDKIAKTITYEDLDEDDIHVLGSGFAMWLPAKDMAGRPVFVHSLSFCNQRPSTFIINHVRTCVLIRCIVVSFCCSNFLFSSFGLD